MNKFTNILMYFLKNIKDIFIEIGKVLKLLVYSILLIFNTQTLLSNHLKSYKKSKEINENSIGKIYNMYTTYQLLLLIVVFLFFISVLLSFYKIGVVFFIIFMLLITFIPSLFIFHNSLLSTSRLILLVISYFFTILSFALIFYIIQMLSIDNINDIKDIAFNVSGYDTLDEIQMFNDPLAFLYFSIVTITTLGYGDITPLSIIAKAVSSLEVILGVTYAVLGVATLFSNKDNDETIAKIMQQIIDKRQKN